MLVGNRYMELPWPPVKVHPLSVDPNVLLGENPPQDIIDIVWPPHYPLVTWLFFSLAFCNALTVILLTCPRTIQMSKLNSVVKVGNGSLVNEARLFLFVCVDPVCRCGRTYFCWHCSDAARLCSWHRTSGCAFSLANSHGHQWHLCLSLIISWEGRLPHFTAFGFTLNTYMSSPAVYVLPNSSI